MWLRTLFHTRPLLSCFLNAEAVVNNADIVRLQGPFEDLRRAYEVDNAEASKRDEIAKK